MSAARSNRKAAIPLKLPVEKVQAVNAVVLDWYRRSHRELPWRDTRDPYAILISEVMLQQTQVDRVLPKYRQFLEQFPTLPALARASRADVIRAWAPLGYNLRAVRLHEIARQAVERHGGRLPGSLEGLRALKGIGRYTAAAVACFAYGLPEPVMDTNVRRVLGRIFAADLPGASSLPRYRAEREGGGGDRLSWQLAAAALPPAAAAPRGRRPGEDRGQQDDIHDWNQALMDLGATICVARVPRCLLCPVQAWCSARAEWFDPPAGHRSDRPAIALVAESPATYAAGRSERVPEPPPAEPAAPVKLGSIVTEADRGGSIQRRTTRRKEHFEGSRRWYRGRIVQVLRALPPGSSVDLVALGPALKPDFSTADEPWLDDLVQALRRDGLVAVDRREDGRLTVALPA